MKHLYYELYDTTREPKDPNFSSFWHLPINNDFASSVVAFAKHNGITPDKVRMFFYETKALWERKQSAWLAKVDWNIELLP